MRPQQQLYIGQPVPALPVLALKEYQLQVFLLGLAQPLQGLIAASAGARE